MTLYRWYTCGGQKAAAANGCSEIVTLLLEHGADPDQMTTEKWTALHNASSAGHHVVVHILIQANVRLEEGGVDDDDGDGDGGGVERRIEGCQNTLVLL